MACYTFTNERDACVMRNSTTISTDFATRVRLNQKMGIPKCRWRRSFATMLLALFFASSFVTRCALAAEIKYVFAHYLMCCGVNGLANSVADFKADIRAAQQNGIDGFILNIGAWHEELRYKQATRAMFSAANQLHSRFLLYFSVDVNGNHIDDNDVLDMMRMFSGDRNYFRVNGRPVLTTYLGTTAWGRRVRTLLADNNLPAYFIAGYHNLNGVAAKLQDSIETPSARDIEQFLQQNPDVDGWNYFGAAGKPSDIAAASLRFARALNKVHKVFLAPVTPFYRGLGNNYRVFESNGFGGMEQEWRAAIDGNASWVQFVTWNDWGESTYVAPTGWASRTDKYSQHWGYLPTHDSFLDASWYYLAWFKTGRPPEILGDQVFYFYRPHLKTAFGSSRAAAKRQQKSERPLGWMELSDRLFIQSYLLAPAELRVTKGSSSETINLPAGVSNATVPLQNGPIHLRLTRGSTILASEDALPVSDDNATQFNFNYYAGEMHLNK